MTLRDSRLIPWRNDLRRQFCPSLSYGRHLAPPGPTARPAAVLIALEHTGRGWTIPLTLRPDHLPDHPGQVSLPGGRIEAAESPLDAALREFREEVGVQVAADAVVGTLQPLYVFNSNYQVTPFLAVLSGPVSYIACPREVARLVHLPLSALMQYRVPKRHEFRRGKLAWSAAVIEYDGLVIWGATAVLLADLIPIVSHCGIVDAP